MQIESIQARHYQIPLPTTLSDSTHGEITRQPAGTDVKSVIKCIPVFGGCVFDGP